MAPVPKRRVKACWDWKAPNSAELKPFDVPFAVKEYLQNQVSQALKELERHEWSDWTRQDLREWTLEERLERKKELDQDYPGMLTGPHGASVFKQNWLPAHILQATIPRQSLQKSLYDTDLILCTVLWWHRELSLSGLSFYNNHLDRNASFEAFVFDGNTTSRDNRFAIGEKGKGFKMATQYLHEKIERRLTKMKVQSEGGTESTSKRSPSVNMGVSFRVGHQIGELKWKKIQGSTQKYLQVTKDDLRPSSVQDLLDEQDRNGGSEDDATNSYDEETARGSYRRQSSLTANERKQLDKALGRILDRRIKNRLARDAKSQASSSKLVKAEERLEQSHQVAITVLGLEGLLTPFQVYSGVYGVVEMPISWRIPVTPIEFYIGAQARFYLRDQIVPFGPPLNVLGVNYHGNLRLTADRVAVIQKGRCFMEYKKALAGTCNKAFDPDFHDKRLAIEILRDALEDDLSSGATIGHILSPPNKDFAKGYRVAFQQASRELSPRLNSDFEIFPYVSSASSTRDLKLIEELGMNGKKVPEHVLKVLKQSGAFTTIQDEATTRLLRSSVYSEPVYGFDRFQSTLVKLFSDVNRDDIQLRDYKYSYPRAVYTPSDKSFAIRKPDQCGHHRQLRQSCLCWVVVYLRDAVRSHDDLTGSQDDTSDSLEFGRVYIECLKGAIDMHEEAYETPKVHSQDQRRSRKAEKSKARRQVHDDRRQGSDDIRGFVSTSLRGFGARIKPHRESKDKWTPQLTVDDTLAASDTEDGPPCSNFAGLFVQETSFDSAAQQTATEVLASQGHINQATGTSRGSIERLSSQPGAAQPVASNAQGTYGKWLEILCSAENLVEATYLEQQKQQEDLESQTSVANELRAQLQEAQSVSAIARAREEAFQLQIEQLTAELADLKKDREDMVQVFRRIEGKHSEQPGSKRVRTE